MASLKSINDPGYAAIPSAVERGMSLLPGPAPDDVELGDALPLFRGRADRIAAPGWPEDQAFEDTGTLHVQIFVDQSPRYFARVERDTAGQGWRLARITSSELAERIEVGIDAVQNDPSTQGEALALLEVPAYYFVGLLLSGDGGERVLPVESPEELGLDGSAFYTPWDLGERFRRSAILGRRPSSDRPEEPGPSDQ
jgi:hypothetical protein